MFNKKPEFHLRRPAGQMTTENDPYMGVGGFTIVHGLNLVAEKSIFVIDPKLIMPQILLQFEKFIRCEVYKTQYKSITYNKW